ncbi:MAG: hypothetical protein ACQETE_01090 [Bacteroidota bacterium]
MHTMKKLSILSVLVIGVFALTTVQKAQAQWAIGASYEMKSDVTSGEPETGFGARIDKVLGLPLPLLDLRLRAHASYFSDENTLEVNQSGVQNFSYTKDITNYDFGAQLIAQLNFIASPYAGIGIGSENYQAALATADNTTNTGTLPDDIEDTSFYWTGTAGVSTNAIPVIKPFVEYRFKNAFEPSDLASADKEFVKGLQGQQSRVIFGILLQF